MDRLTKEQWDIVRIAFQATFNDDDISWRPGATNKSKAKALPLAYVDARAVQDRLDLVVGPGNWEVTYRQVQSVEWRQGKEVPVYGVEATLTVCGVTKSDVGTLSNQDALKGGYSDALKRVAVLFGIGRYLYAMKLPWVPYDQAKSWDPFPDKSFMKKHWRHAGAPAPLGKDRLAAAWDAAMMGAERPAQPQVADILPGFTAGTYGDMAEALLSEGIYDDINMAQGLLVEAGRHLGVQVRGNNVVEDVNGMKAAIASLLGGQ